MAVLVQHFENKRRTAAANPAPCENRDKMKAVDMSTNVAGGAESRA
jgi:hypothetical protein